MDRLTPGRPDVLVRPEWPADSRAVRAVNEAAFEQPAEADLVARLRAQAAPLVSLVAEADGEVVGHILFSPVEVAGAGGRVMGLAPMAVRPDRQRRGVGTALVEAGLEACRARGAVAVVVLGHPGYYPRFGFVPADRFGLGCAYNVPAEAFMALELVSGALEPAHGTVRYHATFEEGG